MINPYVVLIGGATIVAAVGSAFLYGRNVGADSVIAEQERTRKAITEVFDKAQQGAAAAIAAIKPRNVTIRQELEREIQTNTVYRDCVVPAGGVRLANEALTGRAQPAGGGELPGAKPADPKP